MALPEEGGLLEPGTYGSWALGPLVTFTVPDGWATRAADVPGLGWEVFQLVGGAPAALSMTPFTGEVFQDPCLTTSDDTLEIDATPEGLLGELAANPNLVTGEPSEVEVAGFPGLQLDVATQELMVCDPPVTALWSIPGRGLYMLETGQEARFIALDVDDQVLVLSIESFPGADFDTFLENAQAVVDTIEIDTAAVAPSIAPSGAPSIAPSGAPSTGAPGSPSPTP
jgi:hypothetical protein